MSMNVGFGFENDAIDDGRKIVSKNELLDEPEEEKLRT